MGDLLKKIPFDVATLGRAPIGEPSLLPALGGVYLAIDIANRVWYVGKAESIRDRLRTHNKMDQFLEKNATLIAWQTEPDPARREQLETTLIKHFRPLINNNHNFNSLPQADFGLTREEELQRYLQLRIDQKMINLEIAALGPNIVSHCEAAGGTISIPAGSIWCGTAKSWRYSDDCEKQMSDILARKAAERDDGRAVVIALTTSPRCRASAAAQSEEIRQFLHGFLIYHIGKIPKGRPSALGGG